MFKEASPKRNDPSKGECKDRATVYLTSPHCEMYKKAPWDLIRGRVCQTIKPWQQEDYALHRMDREITNGKYIIVIQKCGMPQNTFGRMLYNLKHRNEKLIYTLAVEKFEGDIGEVREFRVKPIMVKSEWHTTMGSKGQGSSRLQPWRGIAPLQLFSRGRGFKTMRD